MRKKILFIGCVESSRLLLERLIAYGACVAGVITKDSSEFNADFSDLTPLCREAGIPYIQVKSCRDAEAVRFVRDCAADIGFCFGWSQLIDRDMIASFPEGMVGFHPAALPDNKGRHPLIWALALGLNETASTFFRMDAEADHGLILSQRSIPIDYEDDAASLYRKVMEAACGQEEELVGSLEAGTLQAHGRPNTGGNAWRKRGRADGIIDWRMSSRAIYNLVRALTHPYIGASFLYDGQEIRVWKAAEAGSGSNGSGICDAGATGCESELYSHVKNIEPGKVLRVYADGSFDVKVYDGVIRILEHDPVEVKEGEYL